MVMKSLMTNESHAKLMCTIEIPKDSQIFSKDNSYKFTSFLVPMQYATYAPFPSLLQT